MNIDLHGQGPLFDLEDDWREVQELLVLLDLLLLDLDGFTRGPRLLVKRPFEAFVASSDHEDCPH